MKCKICDTKQQDFVECSRCKKETCVECFSQLRRPVCPFCRRSLIGYLNDVTVPEHYIKAREAILLEIVYDYVDKYILEDSIDTLELIAILNNARDDLFVE